MANINPRDSLASCWPPSVRCSYATEAEALLDTPREGDVYEIDGDVYYYCNGAFIPLSCCPSCNLIDASAFADTDNPTSAEALIWINANATNPLAGDLFYFSATPDADYVWQMCDDGSIIRIESPSKFIKAQIEIVDPSPVNFITSGVNSFTTCPGGTITDLAWTLTHGGVTVATINGAPASDASGETAVDSGTYETPKWEPSVFDGTCGDLVVSLQATDSCGLTDTVSLTVDNFGIVELVFLNDGTGGDDGIFSVVLNINSGTAIWDMGDGTTYTNVNDPQHVYATAGNYVATVKICPRDLLGIGVLQEEGLIGDFDSIFARTELSLFTALTSFRINQNANFNGTIPALSVLGSLVTLLIADTSITGSAPLLPISIVDVNLNNNFLDGIIPSLTGLSALNSWRADNNDLTGVLPDLSTNTLLTIFTAVNNQLTGGVQDTTLNTILVRYEVENNLLSGDVPDVLTNNPLLERYNVSRNDLTGDLPDLTGLTVLSLYHVDRNLFDGTVPVAYFATNTGLTNVDAGSNLLQGVIPTSAGATGLVTYLWDNNDLSGAVPTFTANTALINVSWAVNTAMTYAGGNFSAANTVLTDVSTQGNGHSTLEVDTIIIDVESAGSSSGNLNWSGDGPSSAASTAAQTALLVRLWNLFGV